MLLTLKDLRAKTADRQRLAGVSLADLIRMQHTTSDLFASSQLAAAIDRCVNRIDGYTQQLLDIDEQIEEIKNGANNSATN